MKIYTIENGFLLEFNKGEGEISVMLYAKDEKDVAAQIIAQRARIVLDGPAQREMFTGKEMGSGWVP